MQITKNHQNIVKKLSQKKSHRQNGKKIRYLKIKPIISQSNHHSIKKKTKIMFSNLREQIKDQIDSQNEKNNELIIEKES